MGMAINLFCMPCYKCQQKNIDKYGEGTAEFAAAAIAVYSKN